MKIPRERRVLFSNKEEEEEELEGDGGGGGTGLVGLM